MALNRFVQPCLKYNRHANRSGRHANLTWTMHENVKPWRGECDLPHLDGQRELRFADAFPFVIGRLRTPRAPLSTHHCADGGFDESHVVVAVSLFVEVIPAPSHAAARQAC